MRKYLLQTLGFGVLLISVVLLIKLNWLSAAKITGIILVILFSVMVRVWLMRLKKSKPIPDRIRLTVNDCYDLEQLSPYYKGMGAPQKKQLHKRLGRLISQITFDTIIEKELDTKSILAVTLYICMVIEDEKEVIGEGKVIVFGDYSKYESVPEQKKKVLFVDVAQLSKELEQYFDPQSMIDSGSELVTNTKLFYFS